MRTIGLALILALAAFGCDSSSSSGGSGGSAGSGGTAGSAGSGGAGGDGGAGGAGGEAGAGGEGGSGGGAEGACLGAEDQAYVCANDVKTALTACGLCEFLSLGCPNGCDGGDPVAGGTPAADCAAATIGPDCSSGLTQGCLDCYVASTSCGTSNCAGACAANPAGCACLDCVFDNCDAAFVTCAGYSAGSPDTAGGPPSCEALPSCEED